MTDNVVTFPTSYEPPVPANDARPHTVHIVGLGTRIAAHLGLFAVVFALVYGVGMLVLG